MPLGTLLDTVGSIFYDGPMSVSAPRCPGGLRLGRYALLAAAGVYLLALLGMNGIVSGGVRRQAVRIDGPNGKPCLGTEWRTDEAKAVIVLGHGVTANQGVMATAAKVFARDGYVAVTIDFWGHGRSRERFDWVSNPSQVNAWCDWARNRYPGLPLAYLGHSMGGDAGALAFGDKTTVDAFVSMGMLPRAIPACKTLIAMGRFEELFSIEQARRHAQEKAEVLVSPFSDHALESADPVLLRGILAWVNGALGLGGRNTFSSAGLGLPFLAAGLGCVAALVLAAQATALRRPARSAPGVAISICCKRISPFRIAAWALGCKGPGMPPRSGAFLPAVCRGILFGAVLVVLLSWILTTHKFTCNLNHPERFAMWMILVPAMSFLYWFSAFALERVASYTTFERFAVGALTRAVPLLLIGLVFRMLGPGIAFAGMMFGILAAVLVFVSLIYAVATRAAGDYRSGAVASGIVLAWIGAFWFPLCWG